MTIYTTIVEPILTYGCECWQITEKGKNMVDTVEMDTYYPLIHTYKEMYKILTMLLM